MKKVASVLTIFSIMLLGVLSSSIFAQESMSKACLGPRGDNTFTLYELLDLFTVVEIHANDGHEKHLSVQWPCGQNIVVNLLLYKEDISGLEIMVKENFSLEPARTSKELHINLNLNQKTKVVQLSDKTNFEISTGTVSNIPLLMPSFNEEADQIGYKNYRELYNDFNKALRKAKKTDFPLELHKVEIRPLLDNNICPLRMNWSSLLLMFERPLAVELGRDSSGRSIFSYGAGR